MNDEHNMESQSINQSILISDLSEELPELIERLKISSDEQTVKLLLENITEKLHQHLGK